MAGKRFRQDGGSDFASQPSPYAEGGQAASGRPAASSAAPRAREPRFSNAAASGHSAAPSAERTPRFSTRAESVQPQSASAAPSRFSAQQGQNGRAVAPSAAQAGQTRPARASRFSNAQTAAPVTSTNGATGAYVAEGSPRPISVDPATTGSFSVVRQGRGAVATTRKNAGEAAEAGRASVARTVRAGQGVRKKPQPTKAPLPVLIGIGVAALVVVVLAVVLLGALISPKAPASDEAATSVAAETVVAANEGIEVAGVSYNVSEGEGGWELVRSSGGQDTSLATFAGAPACVSLYQGTLFIPENLSDGTWDIICYVLGDGSTTTQLLGVDGNPVTGSGTVQTASVEGSNLVLSGDGVNQSVALE